MLPSPTRTTLQVKGSKAGWEEKTGTAGGGVWHQPDKSPKDHDHHRRPDVSTDGTNTNRAGRWKNNKRNKCGDGNLPIYSEFIASI